jgi:NAD(P)-dependent dehydrogenase (short-subunit alcohol dehydrogenase family)
MDLRLQGKRALVTGSSIGLGEAIARALAAEGVAVAIHGRQPRNVPTPLRQTSRRTAVGSLLSLVTLRSKVRHRTSRTARLSS